MEDYLSLIESASIEKQLDYIDRAISIPWGPSESEILMDNAGQFKRYTPRQLNSSLKAFIDNYEKKDHPIDLIQKSWKKLPKTHRQKIESKLGRFPFPSLNDISLDRAIYYSGRDSDGTYRLYLKQLQSLSSLNLNRLMSLGMDSLPVFYEMQQTGFPASRSHFANLSDYLQGEMLSTVETISTLYYGGKPFNPLSNPNMRSLLRRRGLTPTKLSKKTKQPSTAADSIEHLRFSDPAIELVFQFRDLEHTKHSFSDTILDLMPEDQANDIHFVRSTIKTTRTATRRPASTDPNLLNLPIKTEIGAKIREGFVSPPGYKLLSLDYGQIEMCVMADRSRDKLLCSIIRHKPESAHDREGDIHYKTASLIFGVPLDRVDKKTQRTPAKTIGFGILYGLGSSGLSTQLKMLGLLEWGELESEKLRKEWLKIYHGVAKYIDRVGQETRTSGYSETSCGMRRYLPNIWSPKEHEREEAIRVAVSQRIQGDAQDIIQTAMGYLRPKIWQLQQEGVKVHWLLEVHDELDLLVEESQVDRVKDVLIDGMINHCGTKLIVPIRADYSIGNNWASLKD